MKAIVRFQNCSKGNIESLKNSLEAIQSKKDKAIGLYEDGILNKTDLKDRLVKLDEEKRLLDDRIVPIEQKLGQGSKQKISFIIGQTGNGSF
ncbi:hypothetical protein [Paenibacillus sp. BR1-192]|uniref:hypothetical protein n=1 Tax=Paenibacillus sp. BR1-192 TaxID=3032287 RepID=UPI00240E8802|nr:hypothetical protein [Paenibacillus sp. BR1-192]WFB56861.1 hypothetical protein P0X86_23125 [Paenibacillus sp. BR1-192]